MVRDLTRSGKFHLLSNDRSLTNVPVCLAQSGVEFIASPAGSVGDEVCVQAADQHGITMVHTNVRLFHH